MPVFLSMTAYLVEGLFVIVLENEWKQVICTIIRKKKKDYIQKRGRYSIAYSFKGSFGEKLMAGTALLLFFLKAGHLEIKLWPQTALNYSSHFCWEHQPVLLKPTEP